MRLPSLARLVAFTIATLVGVRGASAEDPAPPAPKPAPAPEASGPRVSLGFDAVPASVVPAEIRTQMGVPEGASVVAVNVQPGGPADSAGLKPFDVLLKIAGKDLPATTGVDASKPDTVEAFVVAAAKLVALTGANAAGTKVEVVVQRDGKPVTLVVTAAVERGYLGFTPVPVALVPAKQRAKWGVKAETGVVVVKITKGSPADKAGLKVGDLVLKYAGQDVPPTKDVVAGSPESGRAFASAFGKISATTTPGKEVEIVVERDGKPVTLKATPVDQQTIQKFAAAAGPDEDGEDGEDDEGHEGPEKGEGPGMAPDKAPAPK